MPSNVIRFHQRLVRRLVQQASNHLRPGGRILLHAYEAEVGPLRRVLPTDSRITLLDHQDLQTNRTVGLLIEPA